MNSIFSSFDVVCAEFLGQKVRSSVSCTNKVEDSPVQFQRESFLKKATDYLSKKEGNSSTPAAYVRKPQQKTPPRFAPELDGLHCFETLVSY
ncbi:hypothetical protein L1049_021983 [Liquidambar formosana]|uniref:Uncharacterized protein n=1 Tax=Liquidambar formosana TaxID=63359 RepID=A0AAP0WNA7_LIQFO